MKTAEELKKMFGYTREELDRMAEPWERGEWPPGTTIRRGKGRPRFTAEDLGRFFCMRLKWRNAEISDFLETREGIAEFINAVIEFGDPVTLDAAKTEAKRAAERLGLYLLDYKGLIALAGYSAEDGCLVGRVVNVDENAVEISFDGDTPEELQRHFEESVDCYLGACDGAGREPIWLSSEDFDRFAEAVEKGGMPDKVKQLLAREPRWADEEA